MQTVVTITGRGLPLPGNDIDTDRIIPARFLRCVTFDGLGEQVFVDDRAQASGQHPFDNPAYQGASILVVNGNFGCGSSREHAPQALYRWGIRALVGESFGEIFAGNCTAIGVPCVTTSPLVIRQVQQLLQSDPQTLLVINLEPLQLGCDSHTWPVELGPGTRRMLMEGTWDACGQLVGQAELIRARAAQLPYLHWGQ